jgi:hypothetical protein
MNQMAHCMVMELGRLINLSTPCQRSSFIQVIMNKYFGYIKCRYIELPTFDSNVLMRYEVFFAEEDSHTKYSVPRGKGHG